MAAGFAVCTTSDKGAPCLFPSPNMIAAAINNMTETPAMMNLLGWSIQNSNHLGLIKPIIKITTDFKINRDELFKKLLNHGIQTSVH